MKDWLLFLAGIATELYELFAYTKRKPEEMDPEYEKQLAMRLIRKASDEEARRQIAGE